MRILWMSNAPWSKTGYGCQTAHMIPMLQGMGHEVACFAFFGLQGGTIEVNGTKIYSTHYDAFGNDCVSGHIRDFKADALITLFDPFVCHPDVYEAIGHMWYPWCPIDSVGLARGFDTIQHARSILAMSQHGVRQLVEAGYERDKIFMVPHGTDTTLHKNRSEMERARLRETLGIPGGSFVVGIVQANKGKRKALEAQVAAFALFEQDVAKGNAHLYLHTEPSAVHDGWDLEELLNKYGLANRGVVHRTHSYAYRTGITEAELSKIVGCFDVLLQATLGEGFGIPIIEAEASGVPVIVNSGSAMDDLVPRSELILRNSFPVPAHTGGTHFYPDVDEIVQKLRMLYRMSPDRIQELRDECRQFVVQRYDWEVCKPKWEGLLRLMELDQARRLFTAGAKTSRVSMLVGSADADDPEIHWLAEQGVEHGLSVDISLPDRVDFKADGFLIYDEALYEPDDLAKIAQSGKPFVLIRHRPAWGRPLVYTHARTVWFTDPDIEALHRLTMPELEWDDVTTEVGPIEKAWEALASCLN